jgi:hypothetical protein
MKLNLAVKPMRKKVPTATTQPLARQSEGYYSFAVEKATLLLLRWARSGGGARVPSRPQCEAAGAGRGPLAVGLRIPMLGRWGSLTSCPAVLSLNALKGKTLARAISKPCRRVRTSTPRGLPPPPAPPPESHRISCNSRRNTFG